MSLKEMASGLVIFSTPWNLVLSTLLGVWLMVAPELLAIHGAAATSNYIVGALAVTFAVIAGAEPARAVRYLNVLCGTWLVISLWLLGGSTPAATWGNLLAGLALILLSLPRGQVQERYGGWERFIA